MMLDVGTSKMLANYRLRAENVQLYDMPKSNHFLSQLHIKENLLCLAAKFI